jgi:hypothetical protein
VVCGDRNWTDQQHMDVVLDRLLEAHPEGLHVLQGGARGADECAYQWVRKTMHQQPGKVQVSAYLARWAELGRAAGPERNRRMLAEQPGEVHAFHNDLGASRGTTHMIRIAMAAGVRVELHSGLRPVPAYRDTDARHLLRRQQEGDGEHLGAIHSDPVSADEEHDPRFTDPYLGGPRG